MYILTTSISSNRTDMPHKTKVSKMEMLFTFLFQESYLSSTDFDGV